MSSFCHSIKIPAHFKILCLLKLWGFWLLFRNGVWIIKFNCPFGTGTLAHITNVRIILTLVRILAKAHLGKVNPASLFKETSGKRGMAEKKKAQRDGRWQETT